MRFVAGLVAAAVLAPAAAAAEFPLTGENTKIEFTGSKKDGKHDGGFKALSGAATAKAGDPTTLKIEVTIRTDSLYSDNPKLTEHLKNPDFFDVKTNPTSKFVSTKVEKADKKDLYTVTGDLTLNGKTKAITFPASIVVGDVLSVSSAFTIDRTDFGMNYATDKVEKTVQLRIAVTAKKK